MPLTRSYDVFFDLRQNKRLCNNREAGDLRSYMYRAHYDVTVMHEIVEHLNAQKYVSINDDVVNCQ